MGCADLGAREQPSRAFRKEIPMNGNLYVTRRVKQGALASAAAALRAGGVTWRGYAAADAQSTQPKAERSTPITTPSVSPALAGGRESYADVVKEVAPSVVTIRVEGKARLSPTQFQND